MKNSRFYKIAIVALFFIISYSKVYAQSGKIYDVVEDMPTFVGGEGALRDYIEDNIKYPEDALKSGIEGRVIVRFEVCSDGSIDRVAVVRGVDKTLDKEAIRLVENMPKWIPGRHNDVDVNVYYTLPITFRLPEE